MLQSGRRFQHLRWDLTIVVYGCLVRSRSQQKIHRCVKTNKLFTRAMCEGVFPSRFCASELAPWYKSARVASPSPLKFYRKRKRRTSCRILLDVGSCLDQNVDRNSLIKYSNMQRGIVDVFFICRIDVCSMPEDGFRNFNAPISRAMLSGVNAQPRPSTFAPAASKAFTTERGDLFRQP